MHFSNEIVFFSLKSIIKRSKYFQGKMKYLFSLSMANSNYLLCFDCDKQQAHVCYIAEYRIIWVGLVRST